MRKSKNRYFYHILVSPEDAPKAITLNVIWMESEFDAYKLSRSMYPSMFNSFPAAGRSPDAFHWERVTGWRPGCSMECALCWRWNSPDVVNTVAVFNSFPVIRTASAKNRRFHVPQPTFLFPLETSLRLSRNMLHWWKDNSMLAKPLSACTYLSSIVSELCDA